MTVIEFGAVRAETVVLLHGGGLSWWNYRDAAKLLEGRYHVILPVLDGHGGSDAPFLSIEENAQRIISYIDTQLSGKVKLLGGLSLGGQIAAEILCQRPDICKYALLESTLVKPMKMLHTLIGPTFGMSYGLVRKKWFARMQASYLGIPDAFFDDYYHDTCCIRKEDMISFLEANSSYNIKPSLSQVTAKVKIVAGSREQKNILDSAGMLHQAIPESSMEILKGLRHGELSMNDPQRYVQMLHKLMEI